MINANWLFLIVPGCVILSFLIFALCVIARRADERMATMQEITDATEGVIEAFIRYGYIEDSRSEGDYDLNIGKVGTEKIRKILEGL